MLSDVSAGTTYVKNLLTYHIVGAESMDYDMNFVQTFAKTDSLKHLTL